MVKHGVCYVVVNLNDDYKPGFPDLPIYRVFDLLTSFMCL